MEQWLLTLMSVSMVGDATQSVDVLGIVSHVQTDMTVACDLIAKTMNSRAAQQSTPVNFSCRKFTYGPDPTPPASAFKAPSGFLIQRSDEIVATGHTVDKSGKDTAVDMFVIFRIGTTLPASMPMDLCQAFTGMVQAHYSCMANDTPLDGR
jgi:hypothetical protein